MNFIKNFAHFYEQFFTFLWTISLHHKSFIFFCTFSKKIVLYVIFSHFWEKVCYIFCKIDNYFVIIKSYLFKFYKNFRIFLSKILHIYMTNFAHLCEKIITIVSLSSKVIFYEFYQKTIKNNTFFKSDNILGVIKSYLLINFIKKFAHF